MKNIVVTFIIIANMAFMTGIAINHHVCLKTNSQIQSIFIKSECDHKHSETAHQNESEDLPECCKNTESENVCLEDNDSCCQNLTEVFSINDAYNISILKLNLIPNTIDKVEIELIINLENIDNSQFVDYIDKIDYENTSQIYNISYIHAQSIPLS